jgi:uncharacterized protein (TIGR03663 family)
MRQRLRRNPVTVAVVVVAALALLARLVLLGQRLAHWDEARVAWWVMRFLESGTYRYFPILHGPFLFHVDRLVFDLVGPSDYAGRLVVALVGGLLPLSALSLRTRLDDAETVALAVVLAADPLLLYYSRFMRSDLPVAAFSFATFVLLVRTYDTGRGRYLVAAGPPFALALASKENALLYVLCWVGSVLVAGFVADRAGGSLRDVRGHVRAALSVLRRQGRFALGVPRRHPLALPAGALAWLAVVVFFYAPRGGFSPSLGDALADPSLWPAVVAASTVGAAGRLVDLWLLGGSPGANTAWHLGKLVGVSLGASTAVVALSTYAGYRQREQPRPLVVFCLAWGLLSLGGYPFAVDIVGGWTGVHVVVALAVPAAVGLAALARTARPALSALRARVGDDGGRPAVGTTARRATLALLVLSAHVAVVGGLSSYVAGGSYYNLVGQPAQGDDALKPTVRTTVAVAHENEGLDVAYFGEYWDGGAHKRLPMAWYYRAADHERSGAARVRTTVVENRSAMPGDPPPVVVGLSFDRAVLDELLPGYVCFRHEMDYWSPREPGGYSTKALVYVEESAHDRYGSTRSSHRCGSSSSASPGSD